MGDLMGCPRDDLAPLMAWMEERSRENETLHTRTYAPRSAHEARAAIRIIAERVAQRCDPRNAASQCSLVL